MDSSGAGGSSGEGAGGVWRGARCTWAYGLPSRGPRVWVREPEWGEEGWQAGKGERVLMRGDSPGDSSSGGVSWEADLLGEEGVHPPTP